MLVCDKCKWENPDYAAFCTNCGTPIGAAKSSNDKDWRFEERNPGGGEKGAPTGEDSSASDSGAATADVMPETDGLLDQSSDGGTDSQSGPRVEPKGVAVRAARTLTCAYIGSNNELYYV